MADYPKDVVEFCEWFATEADCRAYLVRLRWPEGVRCPGCDAGTVWVMKAPFYRCAGCGRDFTATSGTLFTDTHKPLRLWFEAIWYVTSQKSGVSALGLQRALGLGSYGTAWTWLHKLRRAMVRPGRDQLAGVVEVDEIFIGGPQPGKRGRGADGKTLVLIAAQADGRKIGRIRLARIAAASAELGDNLLPRANLIASLLKRWLLGTHQGAVAPHHLDYYLDEYTFRFTKSRRL
jgi:transposase-like protein